MQEIIDWKPERYSSVSAYLVVDGARAVIDFLKSVFWAVELRRYDRPDGTIMHAEVRIDDTVVMISDANAEYRSFPSMLHVYVSDVDETYQRALKAGGVPVQVPVVSGGDTDKRGMVKDPAGNTWAMATQMK